MAQVLMSAVVTITGYIDIPDGKLTRCLKGEIDLSDYIHIEFKSSEKGIDTDSNGLETDFDEIEYSEITKNNGNSYEWDGERLTKE